LTVESRASRPTAKPEHQQDEDSRRDKVQSGGEARQQVQSQRRGADEKSAAVVGAQPFVLK